MTAKKVHKGEELVICPDFARYRDQSRILDLARREDFNFSTSIENEYENVSNLKTS